MLCKKLNLICLAAALSTANGFWSTNTGDQFKDGEVEIDEDAVRAGYSEYGVDVSFPIQHEKMVDGSVNPLGPREAHYEEFIKGCKEKWGSKGVKRCEQNERDRIAMSLRQPQSMQNYTSVGFKKIRAPEAVYKMIKEFWDKNKNNGKDENWGIGNTYTNNWLSPTLMVSVEDKGLRGGGYQLKQHIWDAARDTIQEWTGQELTPCSLYGIRIYQEGAILATHVDRLPLVSSAIINVAQDVDEPWPLEVYGHDGKATNVTMEPGDMVLYESHSVLHGRPFPLKGRFFANIFIHFEPVGHSLRHNAKTDAGEDVNKKYRNALERGASGHEADHSGIPSYIIPGSPEEANWKRQHPDGQKSARKSSTTGSTIAHLAAQSGNVDQLKKEFSTNKDVVKAKDSNGWTPLHEAVRAGHFDAVKFLVENGAEINEKTGLGNEDGETALWWAKNKLEEDHPVIAFLESMGGIASGPDL